MKNLVILLSLVATASFAGRAEMSTICEGIAGSHLEDGCTATCGEAKGGGVVLTVSKNGDLQNAVVIDMLDSGRQDIQGEFLTVKWTAKAPKQNITATMGGMNHDIAYLRVKSQSKKIECGLAPADAPKLSADDEAEVDQPSVE